MAENLAYLPSVNDATDNSTTVAKYYVYNYDGTVVADAKASSYYTTYGVLYNWTAAMGVCPTGWHLPSSAEWSTLETYVGGAGTAGTKLKSVSGWTRGITGTDAYGFSALPSGYYYGSDFDGALNYGNWWSATEIDATYAYSRYMGYINANVSSNDGSKNVGFSVRCLQDQDGISESSSSAVSSSSSAMSSSSVASSSSSSIGAWCNTTGNCGTFTDTRETPAKVYKWTKIGTQTWMAENLAYLPSVNDATDNSTTVAKYYVYNYDGTVVADAKASSYYTTYGVLYNWTAAMGVCPTGWHLPSSAEWSTLETYVGGAGTAGTKLKSVSGWTRGITGTDAYGFSALPSGLYYGSDFGNALNGGHWWSATEGGATNAYGRYMNYSSAVVYSTNYSKSNGFSVRCLQD